MSSSDVAAMPLARNSAWPAASSSARRCSAGLVRVTAGLSRRVLAGTWPPGRGSGGYAKPRARYGLNHLMIVGSATAAGPRPGRAAVGRYAISLNDRQSFLEGTGERGARRSRDGRRRAGGSPRPARRLLIDLTPLRRSRDFRRLVCGELVSVLGNQLTTVAVPYQVYQLTHSSLDVGLVSITQLFPLIAGSLLGGSVVDAMDRRRLLMMAQVLMAVQRRAGGQRRPGPRAVAAVRAAGPGGRVQRPGQRRPQRHRAEPGPPVRGGHRERHLPSAVPVRPGGGPGAGRAAAGRARASASSTGWTWPASGWPWWRCS